ncbi:MAG: hypothetical protein H6754_02300 [Candidatus Omnitrophica bacterium]|nr:hypothetical protein [Candidatus Omnitrophota bacterium]
MRKIVIPIILCAMFQFLSVNVIFSQAANKDSAYLQALELVFNTQKDEIVKVEGDSWMDIKDHQWSVQRPFYPGVVDSTHKLGVVYRIDGKAVAAWNVDLSSKTVTMVSPEQLQNFKNITYTSIGDVQIKSQAIVPDPK